MILTVIILIASLFFLAIAAWNVSAWPAIKAGSRNHSSAVSVLIPARNEEANILSCLETVASQGEAAREILVLDDHSTDATRQIVCARVALDPRVRLIDGEDLPEGWCGKNFACARLAEEATGEWLLFLDADARLADGAIAAMVEEASCRNLTMLSCWPRFTVESFWENVLMPMLNFVVFTLYPAPLAAWRNDSSLGLAHGACILVDRSTYFAVGGHTAVRGEVFEDTRLAHLWRATGHRQLCLDGQHVVSVRMYSSFAEIWSGFQKNFFPAFRRESSFWAFLLLHAAVFLLPLFLMLWTRAWPASVAAGCVFGMRLLLAVRFRHSIRSAFLHVIAEAVLILLGLSSWWRCKSGRGVEWKGRRLLNH
ncbi:MAG: glycosyltransferase [Blastocatellia bacterium]